MRRDLGIEPSRRWEGYTQTQDGETTPPAKKNGQTYYHITQKREEVIGPPNKETGEYKSLRAAACMEERNEKERGITQ